jgi:glycosyltransferase involved in cell wall biosynthesis
MSRIRVLFCIGSMGGGGSERQLAGILRHLNREQFEPILYTVYRQGELLDEVPKDVPVFSFGDELRVPRLNYPGRLFLMQARHLAGVIREQKIEAVYSRTYLMTLVACAAVKRAPVPWMTVEVADPKRALEDNVTRFLRIKKWMLRRAYLRADRVLGNSEGVRRAIIDYYGLPENRVGTLYNYLDFDRLDRLAEESITLAPNRFHIVSAGRLQNQKGYIYLLEAADELVNQRSRKELQVHILGQGPLEKEFQTFIHEKGLTDHVILEGYQSNVCAWFSQCDLFCMPSLYEGMPNALLEAMACRVPVISTDCPSGPREILKDGEYGKLIPTADSDALAEAIEQGMDDADTQRDRTPLIRQYVEDEFSPERRIGELESMLKNMLG